MPRMLLAGMAIHLLQTASKPGDIKLEKLKNKRHAKCTIAQQFLPQPELEEATEKLYENNGEPSLHTPGVGETAQPLAG